MPVDDSRQAGLYREYNNSASYTYHPGVVVLPRADVTGGTVAVRVHAPFSVKTQPFKARKEQTPPVYPAPQPQDDDHDVLIGQVVNFPQPRPNQTVPPSYTWEVSGTYTYVERTPHTPGTGFPSPKWPFVFPELQEAAGAVAGGFATSDDFIAALQIPISTGTWTWPFAVLPAAVADPSLSE